MCTYQMNVNEKIRGIRETKEDARNDVGNNFFSLH